MPRVVTTIDTSGPFFEKDAAKTYFENLRAMMEAWGAEGEKDVVAQMSAGESSRALVSILDERVSEHVLGRAFSVAPPGKNWWETAVVSVNAKGGGLGRDQAIALLAASKEIESRYHPFRKTASRLRRARAVQQANLTKGLE